MPEILFFVRQVTMLGSFPFKSTHLETYKGKIRSVGAPRTDEASYSSALIHAFILHFAVDNHVISTRLN